ncbi:hypothetical protein [Desulfobacter sp.]|uniref:hypothetical protein n=1 Tax=Desulfobacter sp. TaxID=2294 RepID=UPI003D12D21B
MILDDNERKRITKEAAESMIRLHHNPDFQAYQLYLKMYLNNTRAKGDNLISPNKEWNQGWCQALTFIIDLPDSTCNAFLPKRQ